MAELDAFLANLRRQRKDLDESIESTSARSNETSDLVTRIEDLRRRVEKTQRQEPDAKR